MKTTFPVKSTKEANNKYLIKHYSLNPDTQPLTPELMSHYSMIGAGIVIFALLSYSLSIITEQRKMLVTPFVLRFLTIGVILDITATIFMIIGSSKSAFTLHGVLGYSSLAGMLIDTILIWRFHLTGKPGTKVPVKLHLYSRFAYAWWVIAFITGLMLVVLR